MKQDRLATIHTFIGGLIVTAKSSGSEGQDPVSLAASGKYSRIGVVIAS